MKDGTAPEAEYLKHEWHWLWSERAWDASMAQWLGGVWWCVGEIAPVSPQEMRRRGWKWLAPAIAPQTPIEEEN